MQASLSLFALLALAYGGPAVSAQVAQPEPAARARGRAFELARAAARFEALASVAQDEHERAWRIDVDAGGRPAGAVLAEILAGSAITWDDHPALARPVALELAGVGRLAALEALAAELDLVPVYPGPGEQDANVRFARGPRARPAAIAGPLVVEVCALAERAPQAAGTLALVARSLELLPAVRALNAERCEPIVLAAVRDARGRELRAERSAPHWGRFAEVCGFELAGAAFELRGLAREAERVARIDGFAQLEIPVEVDCARFELGALREQVLGAFQIALSADRSGRSWRFALQSRAARVRDVRVFVAARDAQGAALAVERFDPSPEGQLPEIAIELGAADAERVRVFEVKIATVRALAYPFELGGLALAHFEHQPSEQSLLEFAGRAPLAIEFRGFFDRRGDSAQAELYLMNTSNRAIREAYATWIYRDARGARLAEAEAFLAGDLALHAAEPLVEPGARVSRRARAYGLPPQSAEAALEVERVVFADGSVWRAEIE